jgi:uncharacterized membrane protein YjjB (DUF3815 family)
MKKSLIRQLKSEDWVIVGAGAAILLLALLFPRWMPAMPKDLSSAGNWMSAGAMFLFLLVLTGVCQRILGRPLRRFAVSLLAIFGVALLSQAVASIPAIKRLGFEAVFFSVIFGLVISNFFRVPEWLKPAIQSEFYIKIGIVCLGATILFGEVLQSGVYALIQAFIVVFTVWYFAFWLARRMRVDEETSTMLASSVSICGVSAAIATCGVIRGDNKKLSYIISLVLVCAVPMMYVMPWLAGLLASCLKSAAGYPRISVTVPSIVIMVPGLYFYRAIYNLGIMSLTDSATWFANAILIIVSLPLGLIFARIITDKTFRYCT